MGRRKTTVYLDEILLRELRIAAARRGSRDSDIVEEALRGYLGTGVLDRLWAANDVPEEEALGLAYEAIETSRRNAS